MPWLSPSFRSLPPVVCFFLNPLSSVLLCSPKSRSYFSPGTVNFCTSFRGRVIISFVKRLWSEHFEVDGIAVLGISLILRDILLIFTQKQKHRAPKSNKEKNKSFKVYLNNSWKLSVVAENYFYQKINFINFIGIYLYLMFVFYQ